MEILWKPWNVLHPPCRNTICANTQHTSVNVKWLSLKPSLSLRMEKERRRIVSFLPYPGKKKTMKKFFKNSIANFKEPLPLRSRGKKKHVLSCMCVIESLSWSCFFVLVDINNTSTTIFWIPSIRVYIYLYIYLFFDFWMAFAGVAHKCNKSSSVTVSMSSWWQLWTKRNIQMKIYLSINLFFFFWQIEWDWIPHGAPDHLFPLVSFGQILLFKFVKKVQAVQFPQSNQLPVQFQAWGHCDFFVSLVICTATFALICETHLGGYPPPLTLRGRDSMCLEKVFPGLLK